MKKFYTLICLLLLVFYSNAQTVTVTGTGTASSYIYGPLYTFGTTAARYFRAAYIYPASLLGSLPSGSSIQSLDFERTGTQSLIPGINFKIYIENTTASDWGAGSLAWNVSGATLVYDSDPASIVGNSAGWKTFPLLSAYTYTGNSLAIYVEYSQPAGSGTATTLNWVYQTSATQTAYTTNQTKYSSSTSAVPVSLATSTANHPNLAITYSVGVCTDPATPGQATSNAAATGVCAGTSVTLNLSGNSTGAGTLYKWQSSPTQAGAYTDISAESSSLQLVINPIVTTWYRAVVKCGNAGTPVPSAEVQVTVNQPLPGAVYTINNTLPTGGSNFQSFAEALNRMSCGIAGPVIFDVSAGQVFNESPDITITGTAASTITFRRAGVGANPKISKAGTTALTDYLLKLTGADYITFDGIDFEQTGTSTTDFVEYGIYIVNASATNGAQNNSFKNGTVTLGYVSTAAKCVYIDVITTPTASSGTNSFNKFLNMKVQNSFAGYYFTGVTSTYPDDGNQITTEAGGVSQILSLGNASVTGIIYGVYGTYQSNLLISNTEMSNFFAAATSGVYGTYFITSTENSVTFSNNHVHDFTGNSTVYGFYLSAGSSLLATGNHIHAIRSNTATSSVVRGIDLSGSTGFTATVNNNRIYDISSAGLTTTTAAAIETGSGAVYMIYNNMISDIRAPSSTSTTGGVKGISVASTTAGAVVRLYYNSIYLNDVASAGAYTTAGIYNSSSTPVLDLRNNLVLVKSDVSSGTRAVAFWKNNTTINLDVNSDNNLYYAGTPGPKNLIYYDGTNSAQQLSDYKVVTGLSPREQSSVTENVVLLAVTDGVLRINPNNQSLAESGAKEIAGYVTDFEGTQRGPYPLPGQVNGAGIKPDIGADEYDGRTTDILGPDIDFTPLSNTSATTNRTLSVTITDVSGVRTGADGPRLYYRKSGTSNYTFDNNPVISGNQYVFSLNYAAIGGVTAGDVIEYYVAAQDLNGYVSTSPFGGSGANPPGITPPVTPATYRIQFGLTGIYTVGPSGNYANLTAVANVLNNSSAEVVGHTIFELQSDYDGSTGETFPVQFNPYPTNSANWTVTVRPAAGVTGRVTTGDPGTSNPLINLSGVDRLSFDGRPGGTGTAREWTLRNIRTAATIGSVFRFVNDATNDSLRYLNLEVAATSTAQGVVVFSTSATGPLGNSFNSVANNILSGRTDAPSIVSTGIYSTGTTAYPNVNNTLNGNHVANFVNYGVYLAGSGNGNNWTISNNHIYSDSVTAVAKYGIYITSDSSRNDIISNNFIGGSAPNATGLMTVTGSVPVMGIYMTSGAAQIQGNIIANMNVTGTTIATRMRGIYSTSEAPGTSIIGNNIHNLASSGIVVGLTPSTEAVAGILIVPVSFVNFPINDNIIYDLSAESTNALTATNMVVGISSQNMQNTSVSRNRIYNLKNKTTGSTVNQPPVVVGIKNSFFANTITANNMIALGATENTNTQFIGMLQLGRGTSSGNSHHYYYNSVVISGSGSGAYSSYGFARGVDTTTEQHQFANIRNNIFHITRSGGSAVNYPIASRGLVPAAGWSANYNDLYNVNTMAIGYWNATGYDMTGWRTASNGDAASVVENVAFVNAAAADLHLTGASIGSQQLAGVPVSGVTVDFDLQARSGSRPYMGADEAAITLPVVLEYFKGSRQPAGHLLVWKGQCTGNNNVFTIERSADGNGFTAIGAVNVSRADCDFALSFTDASPLAGTNYYRLKIRDETGKVSYSIVIAILNGKSGFEVVSLFPTLTRGLVYLNITAGQQTVLSLQISDAQGRVVIKTTKAVQPGSAVIPLDVSRLAAGSYLLQTVTPEGYQKTGRFIKE